MINHSDRDYENLFDEKRISAARKRAEEKYRDLTSDEIEYFRRKCKSDLFFLCSGPLEYDLLSTNLHGHLCRWMMQNRGERYKLQLLPRDHYKSTVITIADSIQMALPNVAGLTEYPYTLGPNIKILLAHEIREKAGDFLFEIAAAFTRKELMLALFSECIPSKNLQKINKWELELPRQEHHRESTFETLGSGSASQGGHYHHLKLDDIFGDEARDSDTVRKRILKWFNGTSSLLTRPKLDGWDLTGTRYSFDDVYSHAIKRYGIKEEGSVLNCIDQRTLEKHLGGLLKVYARGMIEDGELIFPEENDWEFVRILRKDPIHWASQYANNPLEGGLSEFIWPLKFYNVDLKGNLIVFTGDESFKRRLTDLDICIFCDPSMGEKESSDPTGIIVTGVDQRNNIFVLETIKKRLRPPEFIDTLYRLNLKYRPRVIAIEEVNFSGIYRYWIEDKSQATQVFLPIRSYKVKSRQKIGRIRKLSHFFSASQILVHEGMMDLRDEYERFPLGEDEHLLDALAQGPDFWRRGVSRADMESQKRREEEILDERSVLTGY